MKTQSHPKTLQEAIVFFCDPEACLDYLATRRWPQGAVCPTCGREDVSYLATQRKWQCKSAHSRRQFTVKVGTIFEDSPLGLDKWLTAIWIVANCKNGVSSYEIHRAIGVTQKTAWFMLHRIRLAMQTGSFERKLVGQVEVDETFIGGKARFMHPDKRAVKSTGIGMTGRAVVLGLLDRHGPDGHSIVRTKHVPSRSRNVLSPEVRKHVETRF